VRPRDAPVRAECRTLYQKLSQMTSAPGDATDYVDLMLICKHLECILRHAGSEMIATNHSREWYART